jgi:hypothetical protein
MANAYAPLKDESLHFFATVQVWDAEAGQRR